MIRNGAREVGMLLKRQGEVPGIFIVPEVSCILSMMVGRGTYLCDETV